MAHKNVQMFVLVLLWATAGDREAERVLLLVTCRESCAVGTDTAANKQGQLLAQQGSI